MKSKTRFTIASLTICAILSACAPSQAALDATATDQAANLFAILTAQAPTITPTLTPTPTATLTPTASPSPTTTPNGTATALAAAITAAAGTQEAQVAAQKTAQVKAQQTEDALWAQLATDGAITRGKGALHTMDDFEQSWAQRSWYQWWPFGQELADFVLATHIDWKTTPEDPNASGGCGFVFRIKDTYNHLVMFLDTNKVVQLGQMDRGNYQTAKRPWINPDLKKFPQEDGGANLLVAVEGDHVTVYIDGVKAYRWVVARTNEGDIGYTLLSGTSRDFGTYCKFTETKLWELSQ